MKIFNPIIASFTSFPPAFPLAILISSIAISASIPAYAQAGELLGRATAIDGDTLEIQGQRIRLQGIDAPESRQWCLDAEGYGFPCGRQVAFALADWVGQNPVRCVLIERDRYQRWVGVCYVQRAGGTEVDLNGGLVAAGLAGAVARYSKAYVVLGQQAQQQRRGLWAGQWDNPSEWRKGNGSISKAAQARPRPR